MRYWLASGGIHPDKDVNLITIPPPQMVANMETGRMDGFCVGEPWNARAIAEELGISTKTLDIHRANIMRKMKTKTVADLVRWRLMDKADPFAINPLP